MKRRRIIWGAVAIGGTVVIILAMAGVFAPEAPKEPPKERVPDPGPVADDKATGVVKDFRMTGPEWSLNAPEAVQEADGSTRLKEPTFSVTRAMDKGEQRIVVNAREGRMINQPQERRELSGGVKVDFSGVYNGSLTTQSMTVDPTLGTGRTPDRMEMVLNTDNGRHVLTGEGVELDQKQRTVKVAKNVTAVIAAPMVIISSGAPKTEPPPKPPPVEITCDGPASADGFERAVHLQKTVAMRQGKDELHADKVNLFFAQTKSDGKPQGESLEGDVELERFEAEGNVRFKTTVVEGSGTRLVRTRINEQALLEGAPAVVRQGGSRIEAGRIDMDTAKVQVDVPMKGALYVVQEGEKPEKMEITWSRQLHFDPSTHEVVFRGDVVLLREGMRTECQTLYARLDAENRRLVSCRAEGDVRLSGTVAAEKGRPAEPVSARGREMTYDAQKDTLRLNGDAFARRGAQEAKGNDIEFGMKDASLRVAGAGTLKARPDGADAKQEIDAAWSGDMQYSRAARKSVLRRDVSISYGTQKLKADEATVRLTEDGRAEGFDATGKVEVAEEGRVLRADRLTAALAADNSLKDATATGHVALLERGGAQAGGRTITADTVKASAGPDRKLRDFDATGHVIVDEGATGNTAPRRLQADRVIAASGPDGAIQSVDATGRVVMTEAQTANSGARVLKADRVVAKVGAGQSLQEFDATGHVVVETDGDAKTGKRTLRSDRVTAKPGKDGRVESLEAVGQVVIDEAPTAGTTGRVVRADRATATVGPDNQLRDVTAQGKRVTLEEQDMRASGQALSWNAATGAGKLTGSPVEVYQGGNRLFGNVVEFSQGKGNIRISGAQRVEATIVGGAGIDLSGKKK